MRFVRLPCVFPSITIAIFTSFSRVKISNVGFYRKQVKIEEEYAKDLLDKNKVS